MNAGEVLIAMLPEHCLLAGILALVFGEILLKRPRGELVISSFALIAATAAAAMLASGGYEASPFPGQFSVDPSALAAKVIVLALALPVVFLSRDTFRDSRFHLLLLSSLYGVCLLLSADSALTLFLGIELMSLPVYVLVLLEFRRPQSAEAALKYVVLSGSASAMFLMGVSFVYGTTGSVAIDAFASAVATQNPLALTGIVMVLIAFFLKAAIVPFHAWAPDAYEGASVPATAYMATIVKAAVLLAALRVFGPATFARPLADVVAVLPLVSIVWGNIAAIRQTSFRRMIAYSSIAHAGYLFYAFLGDGPGRTQAILFYVLAYALMNLLAFAVLPASDDDAIEDQLDNLKGLFARNPYAAVMMAIAMFSLAGIPPLPGFIAKFLIFKNVFAAGYTTYAVLGLVGSYLGIYFYLRVVQYMFMSAEGPVAYRGTTRRLALATSLVCLIPAAALSLFPGWFLSGL